MRQTFIFSPTKSFYVQNFKKLVNSDYKAYLVSAIIYTYCIHQYLIHPHSPYWNYRSFFSAVTVTSKATHHLLILILFQVLNGINALFALLDFIMLYCCHSLQSHMKAIMVYLHDTSNTFQVKYANYYLVLSYSQWCCLLRALSL